MTVQPTTPDGDLFNEALIKSYVDSPRFLRRDWLAAEVNARLADPKCRFVLLTAEPGAGKSTFMAQLAHDHADWPRYFIRRNQVTPLGDVGAKSFLLRIGYQLVALYPHLFTQERVQIAVEQRIGTAAAGSEVVGAEVKRLLASPFYQKALQIQQHVERNAGRIVGLKVEELVVETRLLDLSDLQNMALFDPARALRQRDPGAQIVVLVDALDEIRYHEVEDNILKWLANCPELPLNIHFVLTSRPPDTALQVFCDKQQPWLRRCTIDTGSAPVQADVRVYVDRLVAQPKIAAELANKGPSGYEFAAQLAAKANGNLGYLDAFARAVDNALARKDAALLAAMLDFRSLPDDLNDLYAFFLRQVKSTVDRQRVELVDPETGETYEKKIWPAVYRPLLGVLVVAREPVTLEQIQWLGDIKADWSYLTEAKDSLLQFLDVVGNCYRLYHATLPEFLTASRTRERPQMTDLYVDAVWVQQQLAARYLRAWGGLEAGLPGIQAPDTRMLDGGYGLRHLTAHLEAAGQIDALSHLLACETAEHRNVWYDAKEFYGDMAGYRTDVLRAWRLAEADYARQPSPIALGLQCRYALMVASLNSLAASLAPALLLALVEAHVWTPNHSLAYVSAKPNAEERSAALRRLAPRLAVALPHETLSVATEIHDANLRVQTLTALVPYLPEPEQSNVLDEALATAHALPMMPPLPDIERRGSALAMVAPVLARLGQPERALATIREIADPASGGWHHPGGEMYAGYRAQALAATAPYLPEQLLPDILAILQALEGNSAKVQALRGLAAYLPPALLQTVTALASTLVEYNEADVDAQISALAGLAPYLPIAERQRAMQKALALLAARPKSYPLSHCETWCAEQLNRLAPHLGDELSALALALAHALETPEAKASALVAIGPRLLEPERSRVIQEAIAAAHRVEYSVLRAATLADMAVRLPEPECSHVLGETLTEARTLQDSRGRSQVLLTLVDHLPPPLLREAFAIAQDLGADVQAEIAFRLPEPERTQALHDIAIAAQTIRDAEARGVALAALAPYLPEPQRAEALQDTLTATAQMTHEQWGLRTLAHLAPHLPEAQLEDVIAIVPTFTLYQSELLVALAPYIPEQLMGKALGVAQAIAYPEGRRRALHALITRLPEVLVTTRELKRMREKQLRTQAKAVAAFHLPDAKAEQALAAAQAQYPELNRATALAELVPHLPVAMVDNVLASAQSLQDGRDRAWLLTQLVPYLSEMQVVETLRAALAAATGVDDEARIQLLDNLAEYLVRLPAPVLYPPWVQHLHRSAQRARADLLLDLAALAPVVAALGNSAAVAATYCALQDVGRWWP